jgi:hypothetical protein
LVSLPGSIDRDLLRLEAELKLLEAEYNMYFSGRLAKPPWDSRSRVAAIIGQYDRATIQNYGDRFRFATLQSRFSALVDLWDRGLRAREEGRPGPFSVKRRGEPTASGATDRVLHVATLHDPLREMDRVHELYESLAEARREIGQDAVPFHKFVDLVKQQVTKLRAGSSREVAFRVMVKDGKVTLTARRLRGAKDKT